MLRSELLGFWVTDGALFLSVQETGKNGWWLRTLVPEANQCQTPALEHPQSLPHAHLPNDEIWGFLY